MSTRTTIVAATIAMLTIAIVIWTAQQGGLRSNGATDDVVDAPGLAPLREEPLAAAPSAEGGTEFVRNNQVIANDARGLDPLGPDPALDLYGTIKNATGAGIANALVTATENLSQRLNNFSAPDKLVPSSTIETHTLADGSFRLRLHPGALVSLRITADGYARRHIGQCQAGERIDCVLEPGATLLVTVRNQNGDAVADAQVDYLFNAEGGASDRRRGTSDAEGQCTFADLCAGKARLFSVHPTHGMIEWQEVQIAAAGARQVELTLLPCRTLSGQVIDAVTKRPIAGARLGMHGRAERSVTTDAEGHFEYPLWSEQNAMAELIATADGYARRVQTPSARSVLNYELSPGDRVRGTIESHTGAPVAGALVTALASHWRGETVSETLATTSDASGAFEVPNLNHELPHTLLIQAQGHGRILLDFDPAPKAAGIIDLGRIALPAAQTISGIALDADGTPLARKRISLIGHNSDRNRLRIHTEEFAQTFYGNVESRHSDHRGRFVFPDLPPGNYKLWLHAGGAPEVSQSVVLPEGQSLHDIELRLPLGQSLLVRVVDDLAQPMMGVSVSLRHSANSLTQETNQEGLALFHSLPNEELKLRAAAGQEHLPPPSQTLVPAGQEVVIAMHRLALLEGSIVGDTGQALGHMQVQATASDETESQWRADAKGKFRLKVKHGERYTLQLTGTQLIPFEYGNGFEGTQTHWRGTLTDVYAPATQLVMEAKQIEGDGVLDLLVQTPAGGEAEHSKVFLLGSSGRLSFVTDSAGRAHFEKLLPGEYYVHAEPPTVYQSTWCQSEQVLVEPGAKDLVLSLRDFVKLSGTVLLPDGKPAKEVEVRVCWEDVIYAVLKTDEQGRFEKLVEPAEQYLLRAERSVPGLPLLRGESAPFAPHAGEQVIHLK